MDEPQRTSTETNKQLARLFFQRLHDGDVEGAVALLDPEGQIQQMMHRRFWPVVGWPVPPGSGPYPVMPMEGFRTELRALGKAYRCQTFRFVVDEVIAESDRVVLTVHNEGQYPDGDPYEMGYCFIFTVRDGKIFHAIEYADTHYGFANREAGTQNMAMAAEHPELADKVRAAVGGGSGHG
jgi:ketosteroid isomerase-like protein